MQQAFSYHQLGEHLWKQFRYSFTPPFRLDLHRRLYTPLCVKIWDQVCDHTTDQLEEDHAEY